MIRRVAAVEARLRPFRWLWAEENADRIETHWAMRRARQPALFDGQVLLVSAFSWPEPDLMRADFFQTRFSRLLAHAEWGFPDPTIRNGFGMGALRGSDEGYLLGVMAAHTANAGRLYFPAGTPDPQDVTADGEVDLEGSIRREIGEETGFAPDDLDVRPGWIVVEDSGRLAFMRDVVLSVPAEEAQTRVRAHLSADPEAELADLVVVRRRQDIEGANVPPFLPIFFEDAFGPAGSGQE